MKNQEQYIVHVRGKFLTHPNKLQLSDEYSNAYVFGSSREAIFAAQSITMLWGEPTTVHVNYSMSDESKIFDSETWQTEKE